MTLQGTGVGITNNSTAAQTFNTAVTTKGGSAFFKALGGGGNLIFNGTVTTPASSGLTITNNTKDQLSQTTNGGNVISAGQVVFAGSNSILGTGITLNGNLVLANPYALSGAGTVTLGYSGAMLTYASDTPLASTNLILSNAVGNANWGTVIMDRATRGAGVTNVIDSLGLGTPTAGQVGFRILGGGNVTSPGTLIVTNATTVNLPSGKFTTIVANGANIILNKLVYTNPATVNITTTGVYLDGTSSGNRILGNITNAVAASFTNFVTLVKAGSGTWSLSGSNTSFTNPILEAGALVIDYSVTNNQFFTGSPGSAASNILSPTTNMLALGGTLSFVGGANQTNTQSIIYFTNATANLVGALEINVVGGSGGAMVLSITNFGTTAGAFGSANFNIGGGGTVTVTGGTANSLLGWSSYFKLIYNGVNFAALDANKNVVGATTQLTQITASSTSVLAGYINGSLTNGNLTNYLVRISNTANSDFFNLGGGTLTMSSGASDQMLYSGGQDGQYMITNGTF